MDDEAQGTTRATSDPDEVGQERPLPYLQAALLCDRVLVEQDGTVSVIRIIDLFRFSISIPALQAPDPLPPIPFRGWVLLVFRSGGTDGRFSSRVDVVNPSGRRRPGEPLEVVIDGSSPGNGMNQIIEVTIPMTESGLHWFEVFLDDRFTTRIPVNVQIEVERRDDDPHQPSEGALKSEGGPSESSGPG